MPDARVDAMPPIVAPYATANNRGTVSFLRNAGSPSPSNKLKAIGNMTNTQLVLFIHMLNNADAIMIPPINRGPYERLS